jgi:protein ImuB
VFGAITCSDPAALMRVAREFSPRVEPFAGGQEAVLDLTGLTRLFGEPRAIAEEIRRTAASHAVPVRVAIAATRTAARLLVRHRAGLTVIPAGEEAAALAPVPIDLLAAVSETPTAASDTAVRDATARSTKAADDAVEIIATLRRWGLSTLGAFSALPADDVAARLGQAGVRWQRVARGEDLQPLVPAVLEERFEQALDLEWPIEGLEPLSFVLGRLLEPLSAHLERRDRGAAVIHVRLHLVTRQVHERSLQLPVPMREARTLRTLLLLDLESHPPDAAIDRVVVAVDPTPGRVVQFSLLTRPMPSPEQISTLMARLHALMGESRCGSPAAVDSWRPGAFELRPFAPREADIRADARRSEAARGARGVAGAGTRVDGARGAYAEGAKGADAKGAKGAEGVDVRGAEGVAGSDRGMAIAAIRLAVSQDDGRPAMALRRFRAPVVARVRAEDGKPVRVTTDRAGIAGGRVESCAGPWRTSGGWWNSSDDEVSGWDRDEWDVTLSDGATYRLFRERGPDRWFIEGIVD